jgi:hypothetical protein
MINRSKSITDFNRFIEALNTPIPNDYVETDLNRKVYEILLGIEFERNQIKNLLAGIGGTCKESHQNLLTKLRSVIQKKSDELFQSIQKSSQCVDLNYTDEEDLDASAPEFYTNPQSIEELLKEVELYDVVIFAIAQKFLDSIEEYQEEYAEKVLTVNPDMMMRLYSLPQSEQRDVLVQKVTFQESGIYGLDSLGQNQREFALSPSGILGFYKKVFDYNWIRSQSVATLNFFSNLEIIEKINYNFLDISTVVSLFQKFGKETTAAILRDGVENYKDLDAWDSLSKEELDRLRHTVDSRLEIKGWKNFEIIGLFKESPAKLKAFLNPKVERIISTSGRNYSFFSTMYDLDKDRFKALTHTSMLTMLYFKDFDSLYQLYDDNKLLFHFFTASNSLRIINSIGFDSAHRLFVNNFHTFMALYNLGECFQVVNCREMPRLVQIRKDQGVYLSPKINMEPSEAARFWIAIANLPKRMPPPPPPPSRRESYQSTVASSSSSSSVEL